MLSVCEVQLQRCVQWRNYQPLLSVSEQQAGTFDPGTIKYFLRLLDVVASCTVGAVWTLFNSSRQPQQEDLAAQHMAKMTSIRVAADKASHAFNEFSKTHYLPPPFYALLEHLGITVHNNTKPSGLALPCDPAKQTGHDLDAHKPVASRLEPKALDMELARDSDSSDDDDDDDDDDNDDDSFAVAGNWGCTSNDESSDCSLNIQTDMNVHHA